MKRANQTLAAKLEAACELVERSDFGLVASISKEHALKALGDLRRQVLETGTMDVLEASMLFSPTAGLEEVAIQNGWGREFLALAQDVDRTLQEHKEDKQGP
jgi:hypothetical protein